LLEGKITLEVAENEFLKISDKKYIKSDVTNESEADINLFTWNKETKTFSAEVSDLNRKIYGGEKVITINNPATGKSVDFSFVKADMDGSNEDTYGWRYENKKEGLNLLIIND
jgi:hypothetical protein